MMPQTDLKFKQGTEAIKGLIRWSSLTELEHHSKAIDIALVEGTKGKSPMHASGMALILLASESFRITLKVFYTPGSCRGLMSNKGKFATGEVSEAWIADFMKELMNMTAGSVKRYLNAMNVRVGLSLPLVMLGFDDIYETEFMNSPVCERDTWTLETRECDLIFKATLEIFNSDVISDLSWAPPQAIVDTDVEFL